MEENFKYEVQLILINEFGEYKGRKVQLTQEQYDNVIKMSKTFYSGGGFELTCEDGSFMIFPPEIVKKSVLKINKIIINNDVQE